MKIQTIRPPSVCLQVYMVHAQYTVAEGGRMDAAQCVTLYIRWFSRLSILLTEQSGEGRVLLYRPPSQEQIGGR